MTTLTPPTPEATPVLPHSPPCFWGLPPQVPQATFECLQPVTPQVYPLRPHKPQRLSQSGGDGLLISILF